jgi:hypothetical protein
MAGSRTRAWKPSVPASPCNQLSFQSMITSPQPLVLVGLVRGDVLEVALQTSPQIAVIVRRNGAVAGALVGTKVTSLINCCKMDTASRQRFCRSLAVTVP